MKTATISTPTTATATNSKTITTKQLAVLLATITKSTIVSLTYFVDESKSRTVKGEKLVQKRVKVNNLYLNQAYGNKVNNLNGTTDFKALPLNGKERLCSTILISKGAKNKDKLMLDGKILKSESRKLLGYFHNGQKIELNKGDKNFGRVDLVAPSFYNTYKTTSGRGSVSEENDFCMITPFLSNIESIKIQKQLYIIEK